MMIDSCCADMDMQYQGKYYVKDKYLARDIQCCSCGRNGIDYFDPDKGINSDPIATEIFEESEADE